jgi:hypothetical protein
VLEDGIRVGYEPPRITPQDVAQWTDARKAESHDAIAELCMRHGWTDGSLYDYVKALLDGARLRRVDDGSW